MKFETENAKYLLNNGFHQKVGKIDDNTLESMDALVFEMGHYGDWSLSDLLDFKQYREIVQKNLELDEPKPIFFVDMPRAKFLTDRGIYGIVAGLLDVVLENGTIPQYLANINPPATLPLALPTISFFLSIVPNEYVENVSSYLSLSRFYTPECLRSAVSANKIENYIAPEIKKRKEEEKANISISYGIGHSDIKTYSKYKWLSDFVIEFHKLRNYFPLDKTYLNIVTEFNFNDNPLNLGEVVSSRSFDEGYKKIISRI